LQRAAGVRIERQQGGGEREKCRQGFHVHDESLSKKCVPQGASRAGAPGAMVARKCSQSAKPAAALAHERGTPVLRFRQHRPQRLQPR